MSEPALPQSHYLPLDYAQEPEGFPDAVFRTLAMVQIVIGSISICSTITMSYLVLGPMRTQFQSFLNSFVFLSVGTGLALDVVAVWGGILMHRRSAAGKLVLKVWSWSKLAFGVLSEIIRFPFYTQPGLALTLKVALILRSQSNLLLLGAVLPVLTLILLRRRASDAQSI